jgi:hypothetical protein
MKQQIAIIATLIAAAVTSLAGTQGSIVISGTVPETTDITVSSQSGYNALPLVAGATAQTVATVQEKTNIPRGYTITLKSQNAGSTAQAVLKPGDGSNSDSVNYSITYGGSGVTLSGGQAVVTNVSGRTGANGVTKNLQVTFSANPWIAADTYSDTITLTIASK